MASTNAPRKPVDNPVIAQMRRDEMLARYEPETARLLALADTVSIVNADSVLAPADRAAINDAAVRAMIRIVDRS